MAESRNIIEVVNQAAVQAATVIMMALRDAQAGFQPTTAVSHRVTKQRYSGPILVKLLFNLGTQTGTLNYLILTWGS